MLHPSITRAGSVVNGIYPNQFGVLNTQQDTTPFQAYQKEKLAIAYTESFSLRAFFSSATPQTIKVLINEDAVSESSIVDRLDTHTSISDGVVSYDGVNNSDVTMGIQGKPIMDGAVFTVTDFLSTSGKELNIVLMLNKTMAPYLMSPSFSDNSVKLYTRSGGSWVPVQSFAVGRAFLATDTISFRVTPAKIELLINGVSKWEKVRSWTLSLTSADLGTVADTPASPYSFGQSVELTTGSSSGVWGLSIQNQEGAVYKIDQVIEVISQQAPEPSPTPTTDDIIPILALSAMMNQNTAVAEETPVLAAEATDWGKIATYGGIALAGVVLLFGLVYAFRSE